MPEAVAAQPHMFISLKPSPGRGWTMRFMRVHGAVAQEITVSDQCLLVLLVLAREAVGTHIPPVGHPNCGEHCECWLEGYNSPREPQGP